MPPSFHETMEVHFWTIEVLADDALKLGLGAKVEVAEVIEPLAAPARPSYTLYTAGSAWAPPVRSQMQSSAKNFRLASFWSGMLNPPVPHTPRISPHLA